MIFLNSFCQTFYYYRPYSSFAAAKMEMFQCQDQLGTQPHQSFYYEFKFHCLKVEFGSDCAKSLVELWSAVGDCFEGKTQSLI